MVSKRDLREFSDQRLLALLKKNDKQAFSELYNRYWEPLYKFGFSVLEDEGYAKDVVQDIFFAIWRNRMTLDIRNLSAYLFTSVKFEVTRRLRKGRLTESHEAYLAGLPSANSVENTINLHDLEQQLKSCLDQLPDRCKEIFYLSRNKNLSNKEIAKKLSLSQRTVEWHISNALRHIRLSINELVVLFWAWWWIR